MIFRAEKVFFLYYLALKLNQTEFLFDLGRCDCKIEKEIDITFI